MSGDFWHFTIEHKGKIYYNDYLDSDGQILNINRDNWEVLNEEFEEINNEKLKIKLIKFGIKHFNDYQPKYENLTWGISNLSESDGEPWYKAYCQIFIRSSVLDYLFSLYSKRSNVILLLKI